MSSDPIGISELIGAHTTSTSDFSNPIALNSYLREIVDADNYILIANIIPSSLSSYAYALSNPLLYFDSNGEEPEKYQKPPNPNKKKGADKRRPGGNREKNVGHPNAEEHSRRPKGNRPIKGPKGGGFLRCPIPILICPICDLVLPPEPEIPEA